MIGWSGIFDLRLLASKGVVVTVIFFRLGLNSNTNGGNIYEDCNAVHPTKRLTARVRFTALSALLVSWRSDRKSDAFPSGVKLR